MKITYAALSKFPFQHRERILADWLTRFAWEVLNDDKIEEPPREGDGSQSKGS